MKALDYREMPEDELSNALNESNEELFKLKLQQSLAQLEDPARIRTVRRQIARIRTIMSERNRAATPAQH